MTAREELMDQASVYLAMWVALEAFDPGADRWSEPTDFGSREERLQAAQRAIQLLNSHGALTEPLKKDIEEYEELISRLKSDLVFGTSEIAFARRLRDEGRALIEKGVARSNVASL